jgi:hypothetical protein
MAPQRVRGCLLLAGVFSVLMTSLALAAAPQPHTTSSTPAGIKWHPGHYVWLDRSDIASPTTQSKHLAQIDAMGRESTIRGVQLLVLWSDLEGDQGDYSQGFAILDKYIAELSKYEKRLMLGVLPGIFGSRCAGLNCDLTDFWPAYIVNGSNYGISELNNSKGVYARVWQPATMDRYIALYQALGNRYDSYPNVEMVVAGETAIDIKSGVDGFSSASYEAQLKRFYVAARAAWPHTQLRLAANYLTPDSLMEDLYAACAQVDCAIGGPDVIPGRAIQANQIFSGAIGGIDYRGVLPWIAEIQSPELGGNHGTFTAQQLYTDAMTNMQASYYVWYQNGWLGGPAQRWTTGILPFIRSINGQTITTCPSSFRSRCITN